MGLDYKKTN